MTTAQPNPLIPFTVAEVLTIAVSVVIALIVIAAVVTVIVLRRIRRDE